MKWYSLKLTCLIREVPIMADFFFFFIVNLTGFGITYETVLCVSFREFSVKVKLRRDKQPRLLLLSHGLGPWTDQKGKKEKASWV